MEKKITKKEILAELFTVVEGMEAVGSIDTDVVLDFIVTSMAQIDAKAEKAKKRAKEKQVKGDALRDLVKACLVADEFMTIATITDALAADVKDITPAKVTARLTQLVKAEEVVKKQVKIGDRKVMGYALAGSAEAEVEAEDTEE